MISNQHRTAHSLVLAVSPTLVRHSLQHVLSAAGFNIAASTGSGSEAISEILTQQPAVAIVTPALAPFGGLNVMTSVAHTRSDLAIVALVDSSRPDDGERALRAGALTCLFLHDSVERCLYVLERAADGDAVLSTTRRLGQALATSYAPSTLSRREEQVLQLVSRGRSVNQIATDMVISPKTVKHHLAATYAKLGVHNRTDAVMVALRRGIVRM